MNGAVIFLQPNVPYLLSTCLYRFRILDEFPTEDYCDVFWIKFSRIGSARVAKKRLDNKSFYGKNLHICYSPESEDVKDVRMKLIQRKRIISQKTYCKL